MGLSKIHISAVKLLRFLGVFIGIILILYHGSSIVLPLVVAMVVATLLDIPMSTMQKWGLPKWLALTLSVLLMIVIFSALMWLTGWQIDNISKDWDTIQERASEKIDTLMAWSKDTLGINLESYLNKESGLTKNLQSFATNFLSSFSNVVSQSFIILIYIILLLMQKEMFHNFFYKLGADKNKPTIEKIINKSGEMVSKYLLGKAKLMIILFVIYYGGFLIADVPYALFLAFFASVFSIIPYVGNIIGGGFAALLAFIYSGTTEGLLVIGVVSLAQILENYVLTPLIIGEEINLNPFMTVFGVIVFASLWGVVGAIISLPIIAVLKVIFEYTEGMEPARYLLEDKEDSDD
ncbi:putative PurR-regulated permease PerM [Balneicella halophila]|uniref:Putative PurR-regulated permease PerM n=1 Tax=Balneicella halophila TaxID=1537566 RepID=A0A7L4UNB3_BALHA|nr:AI-2E family transporter [Balneicella halophila]PVX50032.1 putative PurR-regulated permease PerM [Balneicella halophila]